ncbi:DUF2796 domain-containing protein [Desulfurivibrio alkaliphilus]|uniref:DUF2796 domain-containing protein n=1 Tax=Desulfurivibrio alkaliphilus (strain DSM 19089 / UNIQEM U267 / AHT2) TaxID=589865 RepID=D6Z069_DESAT|nr:DUF2796 domain-containing protein [Desulfurivibrio alkaliphilus]ADH87102.1 conserved hypothetical protein [Desulfurivibrio alkaliphilus AHT 2]
MIVANKRKGKKLFLRQALGMALGLLLLQAQPVGAHHDEHGHHEKRSGHNSHHSHGHDDGHGHDHGHGHGTGLGAHVHGLAEINLIVEGSLLVIDMVSPGFNKVGFEHQPRTGEQRQAIREAKELLAEGEKLFALPPAAHCRQVRAKIGSDFDLDHRHEHGHGDSHEHGDHSHDHQHGHGDHGHDHHHGHGHKHDHDHDHADFTGLWEFHCERPERLDRIDFRLFEHFPGTERIRVQAVTPAGQVGADLRPQNPRLTL